MILKNLRSDEGDSNENVKKAIGLINKTTNLPNVYTHTFFGTFFLSLPHDFDDKMLNFSFLWGFSF